MLYIVHIPEYVLIVLDWLWMKRMEIKDKVENKVKQERRLA